MTAIAKELCRLCMEPCSMDVRSCRSIQDPELHCKLTSVFLFEVSIFYIYNEFIAVDNSSQTSTASDRELLTECGMFGLRSQSLRLVFLPRNGAT